jgi:t-SNARE complex subunit (syntaxin)
MKTQDNFYSEKEIRKTRNKTLAIYIIAITFLVVSYSLVTAISVL